MHDNTLRLLEYHKIVARLMDCCTFSLGKELMKNLRPSTCAAEIRMLQQEVTEAVNILQDEGHPPFGGLRDLRSHLKRALQGAILQGEALLEILTTIQASREIRTFFQDLEDGEKEYPYLNKMAKALQPPLGLAAAIQKKIDEYGELRDDASARLQSIRQKIKIFEERVRSHLEGMISSPRYATFLQDQIITLRQDRYVLPVKGQYRKNVPGIVHDRSASGQTVFVEPTPVVEMNNRIQELVLAQEEEEIRLLKELTGKVREVAQSLQEDLKVVTLLDFIFAKGKYSRKVKGIEPLLGDRIHIKKGYHPLLTGQVVPIDIAVGKDFKTLVITGPNTGGKTVTLKTLGLFALMAQSGIHLPAEEGSTLPIFKQIFADIGDEQSIEQSLSTFSSHMGQIVRIIDQVKAPALVLLDELGAGTDPREGAALAIALLEFFTQQGIYTIATTHYSELKTFAYTTKGVENAAVEFDVETLSPTYRVIMGLPGKSNAFEIARRLGLSSTIIEEARERLTRDELQVEQLIEGLRDTRAHLEEQEYQLHLDQVQLDRQKEEYKERLQELQEKEREVLKKAHEEARELLRETREQMKNLLQRVKEEQGRAGDRLEGEMNRELKEKNTRLEEGLAAFQVQEEKKPLTQVAVDEEVYISSLKCQGRVLDLLDGEEGVVVQAGRMRVVASPRDLYPVKTPAEKRESAPISQVKRTKRESISTRLDLRGLRAHEALSRTDKYLDDAYLAGLKEVEIIHGKGKGALREVINQLLQGHYHIQSYQAGGPGEGGDGVTLARLKD